MTLVLLFGAGLRFFQLNDIPLRGDEAFTVLHWMREPLAQTLGAIATIDPQPPLAYALYRGFGLTVGSAEGIVRILPALLNLLGVAAMYGVGRRVGGSRVGLIAAALFAASPVILWHAQDARNYGIWIAFSALAFWAALRAIDRGRLTDWVLFVALQIVACYLYYLELLFLGALTVYMLTLIRHEPKTVLRWFIALGIIGLTLALWFLQPRLLSGGGYPGTAGRLDIPAYLTWFLPALLFGDTIPPDRELIFTAAAALAAVVGLYLIWKRRPAHARMLMLYALIPLIGLGIVSTRLNVFVPRYVLSVGLVLILAAAVVIRAGLSPGNRSVPLRLFALAIPVLIGWSLLRYYFDYTKSPDWRSLASYLAPRVSDGDLVVNAAADMAFSFYLNEYGVSGTQVHLPANPVQSSAEIEGTLSQAIGSGTSVWIAGQPSPGWPNAVTGDTWLNTHALLVSHVDFSGLRADHFEPNVVASDLSAIAAFDTLVEFLGADVPGQPEPDGTLPLVLAFEVTGVSERPHKTFVHVVGPTNPATATPLWTQDDQAPQNVLDTTNWQVGLRFRDVIALPDVSQLPPGEYQIVVGWYDAETGERLATDKGEVLEIGTISVAADGTMTIRKNLT